MKTQPLSIGLLSAGLLLCLSNLSYAQVDTVKTQAASSATISGSNTYITGANSDITRANSEDDELSYSGVDVRIAYAKNGLKPNANKNLEKIASNQKSSKTNRTEPKK